MYVWFNISALGYKNRTKVARSNQQKCTYTTCSKGMFLLIALCHLSLISVAQGAYSSIYSSMYIYTAQFFFIKIMFPTLRYKDKKEYYEIADSHTG